MIHVHPLAIENELEAQARELMHTVARELVQKGHFVEWAVKYIRNAAQQLTPETLSAYIEYRDYNRPTPCPPSARPEASPAFNSALHTKPREQ